MKNRKQCHTIHLGKKQILKRLLFIYYSPQKSKLQKEKEKTPPPAVVEEKKVYKVEIKKKEKKPEPEPEPEPEPVPVLKKKSSVTPRKSLPAKEEEQPAFAGFKLKKAETIKREFETTKMETVDLKHHEFEGLPQDEVVSFFSCFRIVNLIRKTGIIQGNWKRRDIFLSFLLFTIKRRSFYAQLNNTFSLDFKFVDASLSLYFSLFASNLYLFLGGFFEGFK